MFCFTRPPLSPRLSHTFALFQRQCWQSFLLALGAHTFSVCLRSQKVACAASSSGGRQDHRVVCVIKMTALTPVAIQPSGGQCFAPKRIRSRSNGLKVIRSHTSAVATEVIKLESFRDSAINQFVGEPVRLHALCSTPVNDAIPLVIQSSCPCPAVRTGWLIEVPPHFGRVNLRPESLLNGSGHKLTGATVADSHASIITHKGLQA